MSSYPPYNNDNPYAPPTQYPPTSGYYSPEQPSYGYQQQGYQMAGYAPAPIEDPRSSQAMIGMILGIVSLFIPIVAIGGIIFSIMGMKSITRKGMAIAGLVTSIIGILEIVLSIVLVIVFIVIAAASNAGS